MIDRINSQIRVFFVQIMNAPARINVIVSRSDLSGTARPPSFQSVPTEPARGQPPPYETVKNERVNGEF